MGYESKIYIVQESPYHATNELPYGDVIAMFDLRKVGYNICYGKTFPSLFDEERTCIFYADDGNTELTEDCYGDEITKADNHEVIRWLKADIKGRGVENAWHRENILLDTLLSLEKNNVEYSLYHFGY